MNCLITGGNRGLGLEWVKQLSGKEKIVFAGCREPKNADKLNKLIPSKNIFELDVANENSIRNVINQLKTRVNRLDLLINNAGIIGNRAGLKKMEIEDHLETFQTNTLGPLFVTKYCLPLLENGSTVVNISSLMGSIDDDTSGGSYSYRISKAALNMVSKNLHQDLNSRGISVVSFHPGWVRTRMGTPVAPVSTKRSVAGMLKVLEEQNNISGKFINFKGEELPW
ncbi:MAG: SDR family oxidoreductase [Candidatus Marinimicrobia bacterium]|jgi:NAD(P)-dependent dehydrogenase (short-subunit alcohol dehydrogenase family)|nr:SDR family oxidoreductase [Candidatus Neomarinimicrobiota bacterium]|tara:strand:+ start:9311 stop:9985 length:675 start_codon:yes stop_codon:yes gene_type:complete